MTKAPEVEETAEERCGEQGDTLLEVLLALIVLGTAVVAIMLAFGTSITSSREYRTIALTDTVLRNAAEQATTQMQQPSTNWTGCDGYKSIAFTGFPSGYSVSVSSVKVWNGSTFLTYFDGTTTTAANCTANSAQMITITVTYKGISTSITTVVANPNAKPVITSKGKPTQLVFLQQPTDTINGASISPPPVVAVEDASGLIVANDLSAVSLTINSGPGSISACTGSSFYGVITFSNCVVSGIGASYSLAASDPQWGLSKISSTFNVITGPVSQLIISPTSFSSIQPGATLPSITVTTEDAYGNIVKSADTIQLSLSSGSFVSGTPSATVSTSTGTATFSGLKINTAGTQTITATDLQAPSAASTTPTIYVIPPSATISTPIDGTTYGSNWGGQLAGSASVGPGLTISSVSLSILDATANTYWNGATWQSTATTVTPTGTSSWTYPLAKAALVSPHSYMVTANVTDSLGNVSTAAAAAGFIFNTSPAKITITTPAGTLTGGTAFGTQPTITLQDVGGGTVVTDSTTTVTLSLSGGSGATLSCGGTGTNGDTFTFTAGVVTTTGCKIDKASSGYTITGTTSSSFTATTNSFTIGVGPAAKLAFTTQPNGGALGATWTSQPTVTVQDAGGNTVSSTASITLAITAGSGTSNGGGPGGGTLACTANPKAAVAGVDSFAGCKISTNPGTGYTLSATASGLTTAVSSPFTVFNTAAKLAFSTQPGGGTGGTAWSTQPVVSVEDSNGNVVGNSGATVTLAIANNAGPGGTLSCTGGLSKAAVNGVASFAGCNIDKIGTGYTLTASSTGLTSTTSNGFNVTVGPAAKVIITTEPPSTNVAGAAFTSQPIVTVEDAGGNTVTTDSSTVALAITTNPGGGTLTCTGGLNKAAVNGVASFAGCSINKTGNGYVLTATDGALTSDTTLGFNITPAAANKLAFTTQPGGGTGGTAWGTQPVVTVEDAFGNTVTTDSSNVTLAIGTNPSGGTLACTANPKAAVAGVASFAGCNIDKIGTGYTLTATDGALTGVTSGSFNVTVGPAAKVIITTEPPSTNVAGAAFTSQPIVTVEDAGGNTVTSNSSTVTLAITTNPGGGTLTCTGGLNKAAVNGVASFAGCSINKTGNGYVLTATDGALTSDTTLGFNITPAAASKVVITTSPPASSVAGTAWGTQPVVTVEDAFGNTVTTDSSTVALAITTNPGGGTLTCTGGLNKAAVNGVASFAGCSINKTGNGYVLTATDGALAPGSSSAFNITPAAASQLVFSTQPGGGTGGTAWGTQPVVTVEDAFGNTVTTDSSNVTLAIGTNPSGGTLACTANPKAAVAGVASFAGCNIDKIGTGYTLTATDGALTGVTSGSFNVTVGPAAKVIITTEPPSTNVAGAAFTSQPIVTVEDAGGNTVTSNSSTVTLAITTNPGGGTLTCTGGLNKAAVNGVASFAGCSINKTGNGYVLTATDGALTSDTTLGFNITPAAANKLAFTTQPGGGTGGTAWGTQPVVTVEDAFGNTVTTDSSNVTLAIGTNPSGGTLACTANPKAAVAGVASFAGCNIDKIGTGYTLVAIDGALTSVTSSSFNVTVGPAAKLAFTTQPGGGTGGTAWGTQPTVTVEDAGGNTVTTDSSNVTLAIGTNPSGGTLACAANPKAAAAGVASFAGCNIDKIGTGYTLVAIDGALTSVTSSSFNVTVGPAAKVIITTEPPSTNVAGAAFTSQPIVTVEDAGGNTVTTDSSTVALAITTNPGGGTLTCTGGLNKAAVNGVASFAGCSINKTGNGYVLTATDGALTSDTTLGFNITPAAANKLAFTTQPGGGTGGTAWGTQPVVTVEDAFGNTVTTDSSNVTLAIGTNPSGGTLACTANPKAAVAGVASFAGCNIDKIGTGYTLTATDGALTGVTSGSFNVTVGPAAKLAFTTQPGGGTGGTAWGTQPTVTVEDAGGNTVTTDSSNVTLAIGTNPSGGTLACTANPKAAVAGVASFAGCNINKPGTGYTLIATDGALTSASSSALNITLGPAAKLAFTTQPGGGTGGTAWGTQPTVTVEDAGGNTVTTDSSNVTLAIGTNPSGGTLACTANPKAAVAGVASFAGCNIDKIGTGYTLTATDGALTGVTSGSFNVTVGPAAKLAFTTQPGGGTGGTAWGTQPTVTVEDAGGNTVTTDSSNVTLAIGTNPSGGTLACTANPKAAVAGVASFAGCNINKPGTGYTLIATDGALTSASSSALNITLGPAAKLAFTTQPGGGTGGTAWGTQPTVTVEDAGGNTVTTDSSNVTLAIGTNPSGGTLACTANPKAAVAGVASFAGCNIDKIGTGYTLTATDGALTGVTSGSFNVTVGPAAKLAFTTQPGGGTGGTAWGTQPTVTVEDAGGNTVTTDSSNVTLAIGTNPSGGTLACTANPKAAVAGVASFAGCNINKPGTGYTLIATDGALTSASSSALNITLGPAAKLAFTTQPGGGTGGTAWGTQPTVTVEDAGGNTVTTDSSNVTLAIGTNPSGGTLACTANPKAAVAGVASFAGCNIDKIGTGYTLTATDGALTGVTSGSFNVTVGPAAKLAFTTQPGGGTGGTAWGTQPTVTVEDAGGNTVTTDSSNVTLAIGTNPSGGTLACTANPKAAVAGVASFAGCNINKPGTGYTLIATDGALTSASSSALNITLGPAAKLAFTTQPGGGTGGTAWGTQPTVTVEDAGGNTVTTDSSNVTLAIGTNPSGGTLACTANPKAAVAGVASFAGCNIDKIGTGYTLTATDGALTGVTSGSFNVTVGPAAKLAFTTQPGGGTGGTAWGTQPTVTVEDAGGNTVTTDSSNVTLAIGTNPSGGTLACTANPKAAVAGVASFAGCNIDKIGTGYTLTATDGALTGVTSGSFNVTVGPAAKVVMSTQPPASNVAGAAFATQPVVTVEDAGGNTVTTDSSTVTLAITTNPGGGTLTCTGGLNTAAVNGVASFAGCSINKTGNGYVLTATDGALAPGSSSAFNITPAAASQLAFSTQPGGGTGGTAWGTQPVVTVEDAGGNTVTTDSSNVTLAIGTNPSGGTLACTANPKAAVAGVASFAGCNIDKIGTGYTLTATDGALTGVTSGSFNVIVGPAAKLAFTTQPNGGALGATWTSQPTVTVQDAGGNTVSSTASITLAITAGSGTSNGGGPGGGTLACTANPKAAVAGVDSFAGCKISTNPGTGYTLSATASGLTTAVSSPFTVFNTAAKLAFSTQPGGGTGGTAWSTQPVVSVEDSNGNVVGNSGATVTLAIANNAGPGGTLSCTGGLSKAAVNGVASFAGCNIDKIGTGYTLTASSTGLTSTTSSSFNVTVGPAAKLAFTTQPGGGTGGTAWGTQPTVTVEDAGGNTVTTDSSNVTLAIGTNPSGGTLACTANPKAAVAGVASFAGCNIDKIGTGYTLIATDGALTSASSSALNITLGPAAKLAFTTQPGGGTGGTAWATQPTVTVEDAGGNTVTTDSSNVTLAIGTNPSGGTLACTANPKAAVAGVASFAGCNIDKIGTGYTLTATDGALTGVTSGSFNVTVGPAVQLAFTTEPGSGANASPLDIQPVVTIEDAGGNTVNSTATVTLAIGNNAGPGATLTCTGGLGKATVAGVATFAGCSLNVLGTGYTLTASSSGLTGVTSTAFNVYGPATKLVFLTQPTGACVNTSTLCTATVAVEDASNRIVTNSTASIALAISTGGGETINFVVPGTSPQTASNGQVTFTFYITGSLKLTRVQATSTGLTSATSNSWTP